MDEVVVLNESTDVEKLEQKIASTVELRDKAVDEYRAKYQVLFNFIEKFGKEKVILEGILSKGMEDIMNDIGILKTIYYAILGERVYRQNGESLEEFLEKEQELRQLVKEFKEKGIDLYVNAEDSYKEVRGLELSITKLKSSLDKLLVERGSEPAKSDYIPVASEIKNELEKLGRANLPVVEAETLASKIQNSDEAEILSLYEKACKKLKILHERIKLAFSRFKKQPS